MRLKNKIAFIPGGTAGIGKSIALAFIREGAQVIVASRGAARVQQMEEIFAQQSMSGQSLPLDISDKAAVVACTEQIIERYGRIDIMCCSAGYFPATPALDISAAEWHAVITANLSGAFYCAQAVAPYMCTQGSGRILFLSSGQGLRGIPLMAHYSAAKGGLIALARALASEFGPYGITVNTIAPGPTLTEHVIQDISPEFLQKEAAHIPLGRLGSPEDCVGLAITLASDEGAYITAQTIAVDGGIIHAAPARSEAGPVPSLKNK